MQYFNETFYFYYGNATFLSQRKDAVSYKKIVNATALAPVVRLWKLVLYIIH